LIEQLRRRASRFGLDVVLVNVWEGGVADQELPAYCERWGIEGTVLVDENAVYARALGVRGVPTNVLVDDTGTVRDVGSSCSRELLDAAVALEPRLRSDAAELLGGSPDPLGFGA
jgi:hypothetical protein